MAHSVAVNDMVTRVRDEFDLETGDEADNIVPTARIIVRLDRAYRELYDMIVEIAPLEHFGASDATFGQSNWDVPNGAYRILGIDITVDGETRAAESLNWSDRNRLLDPATPRWFEAGGTIHWKPSDPTVPATLWYVPVPTTLAAGASVDLYNGWDDFLVLHAGISCRDKQEYDNSRFERKLERVTARVRAGAARRRMAQRRDIVDARSEADRNYYNG